jgi:hypothetical protein
MSTDKSQQPLWNSLERWKLIVSALTPITIAVATWVYEDTKAEELRRATSEKEEQLKSEERIRRAVGKRLEIWDKAAPMMNDIYCYLLFIGKWKQFAPTDIIERKRDLDTLMYSNRILFTPDFFKAYEDFIGAAFEPYGGKWAQDAPIKTIQTRPLDKKALRTAFTGSENTEAVHTTYWAYQRMAAIELHVAEPETPTKPKGAKPDDSSSLSAGPSAR